MPDLYEAFELQLVCPTSAILKMGKIRPQCFNFLIVSVL